MFLFWFWAVNKGPSSRKKTAAELDRGAVILTECFSLLLPELEINIKFPTCWDGVRVESANGDHVNYGLECDDGRNECFDVQCPSSHPVKIPELHL